MSAPAAREFRSAGRGTQVALALVMLVVLAIECGILVWQLASGHTPRYSLLMIVLGAWVMCAGLLALLNRQRVRIGRDGQIEVSNLLNGLRTRRFHAGEVEALRHDAWERPNHGMVSGMGVILRPGAHRRWRKVQVINTHIADGGELALFRAIAAAVQAAQPDFSLPKELQPVTASAPSADATCPRP